MKNSNSYSTTGDDVLLLPQDFMLDELDFTSSITTLTDQTVQVFTDTDRPNYYENTSPDYHEIDRPKLWDETLYDVSSYTDDDQDDFNKTLTYWPKLDRIPSRTLYLKVTRTSYAHVRTNQHKNITVHQYPTRTSSKTLLQSQPTSIYLKEPTSGIQPSTTTRTVRTTQDYFPSTSPLSSYFPTLKEYWPLVPRYSLSEITLSKQRTWRNYFPVKIAPRRTSFMTSEREESQSVPEPMRTFYVTSNQRSDNIILAEKGFTWQHFSRTVISNEKNTILVQNESSTTESNLKKGTTNSKKLSVTKRSNVTNRDKETENDRCYSCGLSESDKDLGRLTCFEVFTSGSKLSRLRGRYKTRCKGEKFQGGCFKRFLDFDSAYTERGCRMMPPLKGTSFAASRFSKLEYLLEGVSDGCVTSPMASLVPLSRSISLYLRFHVCVCSTRYCNKSSSIRDEQDVNLLRQEGNEFLLSISGLTQDGTAPFWSHYDNKFLTLPNTGVNDDTEGFLYSLNFFFSYSLNFALYYVKPLR
ncbi:unnamed protein product [Arctia plantaginis]|uniref:Uncharacterized protein n=1 Tax=Arctia plantaginis TaxID=874455 RepID=A0A8S0Z2I4_ARCPL|nr:unnamed protein product [Arctia plantaginis]